MSIAERRYYARDAPFATFSSISKYQSKKGVLDEV